MSNEATPMGQKTSPAVLEIAGEWLEDLAKDAEQHDPRVGIYGNDELAGLLRAYKGIDPFALRRAHERERVIQERIIGWREWDWPEGFDRFTAASIADSVRDALAKLETNDG